MSQPQTIPTIQVGEIELAAALECYATKGGIVLTGETPEDNTELYMFLAEDEKAMEAYALLEKGDLTVNLKQYLEKLKYFEEWKAWSYEMNKLHKDEEKS